MLSGVVKRIFLTLYEFEKQTFEVQDWSMY